MTSSVRSWLYLFLLCASLPLTNLYGEASTMGAEAVPATTAADAIAEPIDPDPCRISSTAPERVLTGTVTDGSGARVAKGRVMAVCGDFRRETVTATDGTFSLNLAEGSYLIVIKAPRFATITRQVKIAADTPNEANVSLTIARAQSTITVNEDLSYAVTETTSGTKTDTPLMEVPQAISVVNRRLLDDQGAVKLDDALKNVAGVVPGGYYDGWDYYRIRGFDASFNTYIDGLRGGNGVAEETFGLESVQVLKGPSSALYGQSVLGGLVDLQSKKPAPDRFATIQFTGGSFRYLEPAIDVDSALNRSHSIFGRLVALYQTKDSYVDYVYNNRVYVAPSVTWRIDSGTTLTFLSRFQKDTGRAGFPLPAAGTVLPNINGEIPISTFVGQPDANRLEQDNQQFGYQLKHSFSDAISVQQNARFAWYNEKWDNVLYPAFLADDQRTLYRYPLNWNGSWKAFDIDTAGNFRVSTGPIQHDVLVGVDYYRNPNSYVGESIDFSDMSQYIPLDLFHPVYGATLPALTPYTSGNQLSQYTGIYLQDQIKLLPKLSLTLSGRYDFASTEDIPGPSHDDQAFTPRVGLSYQLRPAVALYASFSKSFMPQTSRAYDGSESGAFISPEKGKQWEAGIKTAFLSGRLNTTFALYDLTRSNVATTDPDHANFYLVTGQQRSRGAEVESTLRVMPGLNVIAGYAYVDAKVTQDNDIPAGTPTINSPRNAFNAWTTYEFQKTALRGLGFGVGGRFYTDQAGDVVNSFQLPSYGLVDASAFYRRGRAQLQVNFYNLGDVRYFAGSYNDLYVKPGEPFAVRSTLAWTF